ncbi:MAG: hypothetical protein QG672_1623, partial [Pseudomonadota bacterium]|nr:hypothetical protein [Pseudomonadota bacterium]
AGLELCRHLFTEAGRTMDTAEGFEWHTNQVVRQ